MHALWIVPLYLIIGAGVAMILTKFLPEKHRVDTVVNAVVALFLWPAVVVYRLLKLVVVRGFKIFIAGVDRVSGETARRREVIAEADRLTQVVTRFRQWKRDAGEAEEGSVVRFVAREMLLLLKDDPQTQEDLCRYDELLSHGHSSFRDFTDDHRPGDDCRDCELAGLLKARKHLADI